MKIIKKLFSKIDFINSVKKESLRENIANVLDDKENIENISRQERLMLRNVLKINEITARDIMTPRANISAVEIGCSINEVLEVFLKEAHSRAPIFENNLDNVTGMIHIKDLLKYQNNENNQPTLNFLYSIKKEIIKKN